MAQSRCVSPDFQTSVRGDLSGPSAESIPLLAQNSATPSEDQDAPKDSEPILTLGRILHGGCVRDVLAETLRRAHAAIA